MASRNGDEVPTKINILTLNCWGLKFISKFRRERLLEIGKRLASSDNPPEIVGLQECWTQEDYNNIRRETHEILPYGKFFYSGIFGGGLAILSKWPIEESSMFAYPLNGRPTAFFRGDWYVGKGVACARVRIGPAQNDIADVFCTHLHAPYEKEPNDSYLCHRTAQAWEIAKLMRGAAEKGHLVIGLGDFNMLPMSFAHRLITSLAPVNDVWSYLHPGSSIGAAVDPVEMARKRPVPSANFNIFENGATCDGIFNTWRWNKTQQKRLRRGSNILVDGQLPDPLAKRLDYIFVGDGGFSHSTTPWKWAIESARVGMTERHPTLHCSLSDHFAVESTIVREIPKGDEEVDEEHSSFLPIQKHIESIRSGSPADITPGTGTTNTTLPKQPQPPILTADIYDQILHMISVYVTRERFQRRARLGHFLASLGVSIACFIGIWWSPRNFVSFILCLVSSLSLAAGTIDGLIGGLFVSSELRALKEFEWEVKNARRTVLGLGLDIEEELRSNTTQNRGW
ncbi:phospholipase C type enzyme [Onygenales sp. PD_10]|nr:phospholipase C type enzyme [Onygenales sp. PD_10]